MNVKKSGSQSMGKDVNKLSLRFIVPMFNPYIGVPTYSIEYDCLIRSVLLNDLRNLYKKTLKFEADLWELNELGSLEKLAKVCPEHHKKIFITDQSSYNIDLIKKSYADEYEFLINTKLNEISIEEYKQRYQRIIKQLNSAVSKLTSMRELISNYIRACDTNDEEQLAIYRPIIERCEKGNRDLLNINKQNIVEQTENEHDHKIENIPSNKKKASKLIKCFISRRKFINAFVKLSEEHDVNLIKYGDLLDLESNINKHFEFIETQGNSSVNSYIVIPKLRWTQGPRLLVYFIQQLKDHKVIDFMTIKMSSEIISHFCMENGEDYTSGQISDAKTKLKGNKGARTKNIKYVPTDFEFVTEFIGYLELS